MEPVLPASPSVPVEYLLWRKPVSQLTLLKWWASSWKAFSMGIFLVYFFSCMTALLWSDGRFKPFALVNVKMLTASLLLFIIASLDVAFHLRHNLEAFIWYNGPAIEVFNKTSSWINVVKMGCYVAQTFVGDSILIFRCWVIYNRNWSIVALPILLWLGTTACGIMTVQIEATQSSDQLLNSSHLVPFISTSLCLTLATNIITTSLIVFRIWKIRSKIGLGQLFNPTSPLTNVVIVLIESGLLYTLSIIILVGLYLASNNGQYGVSNSIVQIIGITFNLVIASVDRRESRPGTTSPVRSQPSLQGVALHKIRIHTTVDRHADNAATSDIDGSDIQLRSSSQSLRIKEWWQADSVTTPRRS